MLFYKTTIIIAALAALGSAAPTPAASADQDMKRGDQDKRTPGEYYAYDPPIKERDPKEYYAYDPPIKERDPKEYYAYTAPMEKRDPKEYYAYTSPSNEDETN
ncbi:hypothetical protein P280DRAFT_299694 [Massarina eburnea CBS 473.64]|uniref:Uncharacterized protein n=1 Tax=Massarina eburnea CBS 473.64 TaxID=1395130 RepID=A0A6A6S3L4_9PLEO|nr:hypothetical protein P280DRAFT_299694 [Massarina eburnea CBS 473.64]